MSAPASPGASIGWLLRSYASRTGRTQEEISSLLGISQSYLSLLTRDKRVPRDWDLRLRICNLVGVHPHVLGLSDAVRSSSNAELIYENSLIALGSGDLITAEAGFSVLAGEVARRSAPELQVSDGLRTRARFRLANIRRDWFLLDGRGGAIALYRTCLPDFASEGAIEFTKEATLFLAVCSEMQNDFVNALTAYDDIAEAEQPHSQLRARAKNRCGAILTKQGYYEDAKGDLDLAKQIAVHGDSQSFYAFVLEKLAVWYAHQRQFDAARSCVDLSRQMILPGEALREVQNDTLRADISIREGDLASASKEIEIALTKSKQHDFKHQTAWIENMKRSIHVT